jgi:hypothetical protein
MFGCMLHWYILNCMENLVRNAHYLLAMILSVFSLALQDKCSNVSLKHQKPLTQLHSITSQKTGILSYSSVKTLQLALWKFTGVISVHKELRQYGQAVRFRHLQRHTALCPTLVVSSKFKIIDDSMCVCAKTGSKQLTTYYMTVN